MPQLQPPAAAKRNVRLSPGVHGVSGSSCTRANLAKWEIMTERVLATVAAVTSIVILVYACDTAPTAKSPEPNVITPGAPTTPGD